MKYCFRLLVTETDFGEGWGFSTECIVFFFFNSILILVRLTMIVFLIKLLTPKQESKT